MANQQRFEGQDLASVLDRVREVYGEDARIVAANRLRKGGVGGFFARELYEVIVEVEDEAVPENMVAAAAMAALAPERERQFDLTADAPGHPILDLAEAVSEVEKERAALRAAGRALAREIDDRRRLAPRVEPLDLEDLTTFDEPTPSTPAPVSTESAQFASILARIADSVEGAPVTTVRPPEKPTMRMPEPEVIVAEPVIDDVAEAIIVNDGPDSAELWIDDDGTVTTVQPFAPPRLARVVSDVPREERPAVMRADEVVAVDTVPSTPPVPPVPTGPYAAAPVEAAATVAPAPTAVVAPEPRLDPVAPRRTEPAPADQFGAELAAALRSTPEVRRSATPLDAPPDTIERPEFKLVDLGVPTRMVPRGVRREDLETALAESLSAHLPVVTELPQARGVVIAAVGIGREAIDLGRSLAVELSLDHEEVVVAIPDPPFGTPDWLVIPDAACAAERRQSWQRRSSATVVSVVVDPARGATNGWKWAREILDKLEPTRAWMIADARSKSADIAARIDMLGGVDLLALEHLEDTVSPASALDLGLPIGRLGGQVATPAMWSHLLVRRLVG